MLLHHNMCALFSKKEKMGSNDMKVIYHLGKSLIFLLCNNRMRRWSKGKNVMFLLGISENKATRKEFAIYRSNVVVPNGAGFFPPKTFCFAEMTSRVFNIVLEGSFQRSCYEPGSTMLKTRDVIEAKLKV